MPNFSSPKTSLPDLMPVDQDRSPEVSSQELQAIKVNLMETTMRTKDIVDVLIRRNSLLSRDVEKISDLKRRLQDTNPIIPSLPGWAGFLLGAGVGAGAVVGMGGGGRKFMPPGKVRDKVPTLVPAKAKTLKALKAKVSVKQNVLKSKTVNALNSAKVKAALPQSKLQQVITSSNKSPILETVEATVDKKLLNQKTSKALTSGVNNVNNKTNNILKSNTTSVINSGIKSVTPKSSVKGLLTGSKTTTSSIIGNNVKKNIKKVDLSKIKTNKLLGSQNIKDWGKKSPLITGLDPRNGEILTKQQRINFKNTGKLPDLKVNASSGSTSKFLSKLKGIRIKPNDVKGLVIGAILNEAVDRLILNPFERWTVRQLIKRHGYDKAYEREVAELQKQLDKKDHNAWMTVSNIVTLGLAGFIGQAFGFKDYEMLRQAVRRVKYMQDNESTLRALNNKKNASITPPEGSKINNIASASSVPFNTDSLNLNTHKKDTVVILTDSIA